MHCANSHLSTALTKQSLAFGFLSLLQAFRGSHQVCSSPFHGAIPWPNAGHGNPAIRGPCFLAPHFPQKASSSPQRSLWPPAYSWSWSHLWSYLPEEQIGARLRIKKKKEKRERSGEEKRGKESSLKDSKEAKPSLWRPVSITSDPKGTPGPRRSDEWWESSGL